MKRTTILMLTIIFSSTSLYAQSFSWYEYKKTKLDAKDGIFNKGSDTKKNSDANTQRYIKERYGLYTTKKSIQDIVDGRSRKSLYAGLEYSFNPTYDVESVVNLPDSSGVLVPTLFLERKQLAGVALKLEGDLDLSPVGLNADSLIAKVSLSTNYIDMDMNYRLLGESDSMITLDAGAGVRAALKNSEVFEKGFYGYGTGAASIRYEDYKISGGGRYLFSQPAIYKNSSDKISPFLSGSLAF